MTTTDTLPIARSTTGLLVEELPGETLIYDEKSGVAHCLQADGAKLWRLCDGKTTVAAAIATLSTPERTYTKQDIASMIDALDKSNLLRASTRRRSSVMASRRRFLGKAALVGGLVAASPIIYSIVSPSVAEAASAMCIASGGTCTVGGTGVNACCNLTCFRGTCP